MVLIVAVMHDASVHVCVCADVYGLLYGIVNLPHCCRLPSSAFAFKHARKYYHTENHMYTIFLVSLA